MRGMGLRARFLKQKERMGPVQGQVLLSEVANSL